MTSDVRSMFSNLSSFGLNFSIFRLNDTKFFKNLNTQYNSNSNFILIELL